MHKQTNLLIALVLMAVCTVYTETNAMQNQVITSPNEALIHACEFASLQQVKDLIENEGADINFKLPTIKHTPLHNACLNPNGIEIIEFLVKKGARVSVKDYGGIRPLHFVLIQPSNLAAITLFIEKGAHLFARDGDGKTPLDWGRDNWSQALSGLSSLFPLKTQAIDLKPFLEKILAAYGKRMTNSINSVVLSNKRKGELLQIDVPSLEKAILISLVQKFIKLLYKNPKKILKKTAIEHLSMRKKITLTFNNIELALSEKLFTDQSPFINLLAHRSRDEKYFLKNIKEIGCESKDLFEKKLPKKLLTPRQKVVKKITDVKITFELEHIGYNDEEC